MAIHNVVDRQDSSCFCFVARFVATVLFVWDDKTNTGMYVCVHVKVVHLAVVTFTALSALVMHLHNQSTIIGTQ